MFVKKRDLQGFEWLETTREGGAIQLRIPQVCCYAAGLDCGLSLSSTDWDRNILFLLDIWRLQPQSGAVEISKPLEKWRGEYGLSHVFFARSETVNPLSRLIRATARVTTSCMEFEPYSGLIKLAELQKADRLDTDTFKQWNRTLERIQRLDATKPDPDSDLMAVLMAAERLQIARGVRQVPAMGRIIWFR